MHENVLVLKTLKPFAYKLYLLAKKTSFYLFLRDTGSWPPSFSKDLKVKKGGTTVSTQ